MRCVDLNFNYSDLLTSNFQFFVWNDDSDDIDKYTKQENELIRKFNQKEVFKMKVYMTFPSFSM